MRDPVWSHFKVSQTVLLTVLWAPQGESACGEWLNINGLSGSSRKIDPLGLGKEQQNVPSGEISEEGTKLLRVKKSNLNVCQAQSMQN